MTAREKKKKKRERERKTKTGRNLSVWSASRCNIFWRLLLSREVIIYARVQQYDFTVYYVAYGSVHTGKLRALTHVISEH